MAGDILESVTNIKTNLDGEEDVQEVYIMPREQFRLREKIFRIRTQAPFNEFGFNLDRYNANGILDNEDVMLDAEPPAIDVGMVLCPNNHLIEKYYNIEFVDSDNTTATYDEPNHRYSIDDGEQLQSQIVQYNSLKAFKNITFTVNGDNVDGFDLSLDVGDGTFRPLIDGYIDLTDTILFGDDFDADLDKDLTGLAFPNKLIYRIENNTGETKYINNVDVKFTYY